METDCFPAAVRRPTPGRRSVNRNFSQTITVRCDDPATIIDSNDIGSAGSAGWVAVYPAPVFTPLAAAIN